jgi:hypothetical protein
LFCFYAEGDIVTHRVKQHRKNNGVVCVVVVCIAVIIDVINVLTRVACGNTKKNVLR